MKLPLAKLLRVAAHLLVAAPAIAAAVKPVLAELARPKASGS